MRRTINERIDFVELRSTHTYSRGTFPPCGLRESLVRRIIRRKRKVVAISVVSDVEFRVGRELEFT